MKAKLELLDKQTYNISVIEANEFLNPSTLKTSMEDHTDLRPRTFHRAYKMLLGMLEGGIFHNANYALRLQGVEHEGKW